MSTSRPDTMEPSQPRSSGLDPALAVIGVPMYGAGDHARQALESLIGQTFRRVAFMVVDDGGGRREHLAETLKDPRVRYLRNAHRLGLVGNWRRTFEVSRAIEPQARYFAWGSDHDVWHPRWLEAMIAALEGHPRAVLAYPRFTAIEGERVRARRGDLDTRHIDDPARRLVASYGSMKPGYMVYGLYRVDALERCGALRPVLLPDRLLLAELSVAGPFIQVQEQLWYRRRVGRYSLARQRRSLFPARRSVRALVPWWISHVVTFWWTVAPRRRADRVAEGPRLAALHARLCVAWAMRRWRRTTVAALRRALGKLPRALARGRY